MRGLVAKLAVKEAYFAGCFLPIILLSSDCPSLVNKYPNQLTTRVSANSWRLVQAKNFPARAILKKAYLVY